VLLRLGFGAWDLKLLTLKKQRFAKRYTGHRKWEDYLKRFRQRKISRQQNLGHNHNLKTVNKLFENVAKLKYSVMILLRNKHFMHEEIKCRYISESFIIISPL